MPAWPLFRIESPPPESQRATVRVLPMTENCGDCILWMGANAPTHLRPSEAMATACILPPTSGRRYTLDEFDQLFPERDWNIELLDGQVIVRSSPTSWHQELCIRLALALGTYAISPRLGRVFAPGAFVVPPYNELHADVLVTPWTPHLLDWHEM